MLSLLNYSKYYTVKRLTDGDISDVVALCSMNKIYYQFCPPFVTEESIADDMTALPPGVNETDKHYVGFYDADKLIAVMDLITGFPDEQTAFIGFFMTDVSVQNAGVGTTIINELFAYLRELGFKLVKLGWVQGNPQAEHFWKKNGFIETGDVQEMDDYSVVVAQRFL